MIGLGRVLSISSGAWQMVLAVWSLEGLGLRGLIGLTQECNL